MRGLGYHYLRGVGSAKRLVNRMYCTNVAREAGDGILHGWELRTSESPHDVRHTLKMTFLPWLSVIVPLSSI